MIKRKLTLEDRINRLEKMLKNEAVNGADVIFKNKLWTVYRVTTYQAARSLGSGTVWGISGKLDRDFYQENGVNNGEGFYNWQVKKLDGGFYFYIKNRDNVKFCLARKPNGTIAWIQAEDGTLIKPNDIMLADADFPSVVGVFVPKDSPESAKDTKAFISAIAKGDKATVARLIEKGVDLERPDIDKAIPLTTAIFYNQYEIARMLLEAGVDPNGPSAKNAMFQAVAHQKYNKDSRYVDLLVEYGCTLPQRM